ncbi:hypothetical protein F4813DRAFT_388133 [Daldinia decipiens]|uniref:uncharacterized protein n=1 Tax=Daldinia decipiens TaxID=326647 RepID=UPI0020C21E28|nr:uncharacterized protein F4813DRAFT_388133 [Daldinia decipiens]KAI1658873.1 hypothetical protein F4813DRAFT_388133 [Daldinia decipiens]
MASHHSRAYGSQYSNKKGPGTNRKATTQTRTQTTDPEYLEDPKVTVQELLQMVKGMGEGWGDSTSTDPIKGYITSKASFGTEGDKSLLRLIKHTNKNSDSPESIWADDTGRLLLIWMLKDPQLAQLFVKQPEESSSGEDELSGRLPIHFAIENKAYYFLACLFKICYDFKLGQGLLNQNFDQEPDRIFEYAEGPSKMNCIHFAMKSCLPFAPFMVAVCSAKALTQIDSEGYTPLHRAMNMVMANTECLIPPQPAMNPGEENSPLPHWDNKFTPPHVLEEIERRKDADNILRDILTTTNNKGRSPYQENLDKYRYYKGPCGEFQFKRSFKTLIFQKIRGIPNVSKALYGTSGNVKELCLDMSDFNQSSHNFEKFVEKLTSIDDEDEGVDLEDDSTLQFEDTLFFVHLPDLNYVKQPCPHETLRMLFEWLRDKKHVEVIRKLTIPDNTINPMNPVFFEQHILDKFEIQALDWRTLDMNLDILTGSTSMENTLDFQANTLPIPQTRLSLRELTLYSSGNWSVLYHWISKDGLAKVANLQKVRIEIVHLDLADGVHDKNIHERHRNLSELYKSLLESYHLQNKTQYESNMNINFNYKLDVRLNAKWHYPPPSQEPEEPTTRVPMHQFTGQLGPCQKFLDELKGESRSPTYNAIRSSENRLSNISNQQASEGNEDFSWCIENFHKYTSAPARDRPDKRIKVAIIDNGADRIRSSIGEMIAKGVSYVTADLFGSDKPLPWWMVSDAHGTQMASLIGQINPYCRLYIARVGKGRSDIDPKNAAKAVKWALDQKVDIISMSWTTKKDEPELESAISEAANSTEGRATLMFCSTADEGLYSDAVYPADYERHVVRVSATDQWGHLTARTHGSKAVNIQIPGENTEAVGPAYIGSVLPTVSGSSVATALAAGIASLALLLLRTYNKDLKDKDIQPFYQKQNIMKIFNKMDADKGGLQLSKLFPRETTNEHNTHKTMRENWNIHHLEKLPGCL